MYIIDSNPKKNANKRKFLNKICKELFVLLCLYYKNKIFREALTKNEFTCKTATASIRRLDR